MDIRKFTPSLGAGLAYGLLFLMLCGLFILGYHRLRLMSAPPKLVVLLVTTAIFCLPLLQTYPFNATDIYRYIIRGRVNSVHHANSYASPPTDFPDDPFFPLAGEWANETSPYGPAWELVATAVTSLLGNNLLGLLLTFKVYRHLGTSWLCSVDLAPFSQCATQQTSWLHLVMGVESRFTSHLCRRCPQ